MSAVLLRIAVGDGLVGIVFLAAFVGRRREGDS